MHVTKSIYVPLILVLSFVSSWNIGEAQKKKTRSRAINSKQSEAEYYFTEAEKYYILEDYAKSIALFQKSLEINNENAAAYYKIAEINLKNDNVETALENAVISLELEKYKYTYILLADIYNQMGDLESAAKTYEELIEQIPGTNKYLFDLAALYLYQESYQKALETYNKIENIYGVNEDIAFQKQRIFNRLGKTEEARQELEKLITKFPDNEYYAVSYAEFLLNSDKDEGAIQVLSDFLINYPESPRISLLLGEIYRNRGDYHSAFKNLNNGFLNNEIDINQKVTLIASYKSQLPNEELANLIEKLCISLTTHFPEEPNAFAVFGDFLNELDKNSQALEKYLKSVELDADNFSVWQNILLIETDLSKYNDVIKHSEQAMEFFPNQGILYYLNGFSLIRIKDYEHAVFMLEQGKRIAGKDKKVVSDFNSLLGEAYNGLKNYEKSDEAYDEVLSFNPNNYLVLNNYSYYLALRNERLDVAEKMSAKLAKDNPQNPTFLDTHAWVLYANKKYKEAKKVIEKALNSEKANAVHYEHYGDILYKLGDVEKAVIQWQKAKGMDSSLLMIDKKIADRKLYEK